MKLKLQSYEHGTYCRLALSKRTSNKLHWQHTVYRIRNYSMPLSIQKIMSHANVAF